MIEAGDATRAGSVNRALCQRLPRVCGVPALTPRFLAGSGFVAARAEGVLPVPRAGRPVDTAVARGLAVVAFTAADAVAAFFDVALDVPVAAIGLPVFEDRAGLTGLGADAVADDDTACACDLSLARLSDAGSLVTDDVRDGDVRVFFA